MSTPEVPDYYLQAFDFIADTYMLDGVCCMSQERAAIALADYARAAHAAGRRAGCDHQATEVYEMGRRAGAERMRERCAAVARAYEPHCESCPRGVANALAALTIEEE